MLYSEEFSTLTARELIAMVQSGNDKGQVALAMLLESNERLFKAVVARTAPSSHQVPALVQEARIAFEMAVNRYKLDGEGTFAHFAWHCMRNAVLGVLRRDKRLSAKEVSLEELREKSDDYSFDARDTALAFDEKVALRDAMHQLPPEDRNLIGRIYWAGQSQSAIAQRFGKSQNAISKHHIRVIGRLREAWLH